MQNIAGFFSEITRPHPTPTRNIVPHEILLLHLVLMTFGENQCDIVRFGVIQ